MKTRESLLVDSVVLEAFKAAGGPNALAHALGIASASVHGWRRIPPRRVIAVEKITAIPRTVLRPDIYPTDDVLTPAVVWVRRVRARPPGAANNKYAGRYRPKASRCVAPVAE